MQLKFKKFTPLIVLFGFILLAYFVVSNPPTSKRGRPSTAPQLNVDVQTLKKDNLAVVIDSYGTVKPRTQSYLYPQVSGQIMAIHPKFRDGGFFEKGEVLVELDDRDHVAEINIAKASLYSAKQALSEEEARVEQATQDWSRLGNTDAAPDLVLRKPQLLAAEANVYSAEAQLAKAQLALERTKIAAPYTGRILTKSVDIGQVVSSNTLLAEIYAVDYVEIRLPIKNKDLPYMILPESTRFTTESVNEQPAVLFHSDLTERQNWYGKVVRTEGAFDQSSQQLFVVAQIDDPYGVKSDNGLPLKIGQYVSAKINGKVLESVLTIPNKTIYQGSYVYIVENNILKRKDINIAWQNADVAVISSGIEVGQSLVLTPLGQVTSGTPVAISHQDGKAVKKVTQRKGAGTDKNGKRKPKDGKGKKPQDRKPSDIANKSNDKGAE